MLPESGRSTDDLLAELSRLREGDLPVREGRVAAYVYDPGRPGVREAGHRAYMEMVEVNGLDPTAFPSTVALERRVVGAVASVLGGDASTPGIFTSGGTESIMLAVKAARDTRPVRGRGEVVLPVTAHPAFRKACHYLGLDPVTVPVDPESLRATPGAVAEALTPRTVMVVASAPSYPHGVVDPVAEIAALAAGRGVLCHVDACVGGWILPWLEKGTVPPFDLSVPGVTSLSCDLHKYGYTPKGASVVLFADGRLRRGAYYAGADWPGYTVINSTVQSSKGAGPLAGAWATLNALGASGYRELAREAMDAARRLREGVAGIPGLRVLGDPDAPLVALASDEVDVFVLADEVAESGWFLQPQLSYAGIPANLHLTLTGVSLAGVDALLEVLAGAVAAVRGVRPPVPEGLAEAVSALDLSALEDREFVELLASVGVDLAAPGGSGTAVVNTVLDGLEPPLREALLLRFLSALHSPHADRPGAAG
ncbi:MULTISPECIES: pyridoxal phosphate-dependent decarboxylase family protein [Nocardiopsis]|uniref:Pyridoxal-dependent decarboxylase n=1 Tax=Nocardiopsis sinuspersici TaxID=501010 RepID=A0A1V3BYQ4_9ACTN|nr:MULTISPECIES: aspartate aminotransferase family protein [Nocardiopsis]OOC53376.1 pyridoxal-dependent decarboxylase [Nocardiopsis sinuspersici]